MSKPIPERDARLKTLVEWLRQYGPRGADVAADEVEALMAGRLAWSSDPPTVPGDYLYAYRWGPDQPWVRGHIQLKGPPARTASEDRWFGPIPEIEPAKGGG